MELSMHLRKLTVATELLYHGQGHSTLVLQMVQQQRDLSVSYAIPNKGMHPVPVMVL